MMQGAAVVASMAAKKHNQYCAVPEHKAECAEHAQTLAWAGVVCIPTCLVLMAVGLLIEQRNRRK